MNTQEYFHFRLFFSKPGDMQYVSHLDLVRMLQRIMRVSKLPIVYTQGFNIHPKISPGPPLSIGVQGENEYCDFILFRNISLQEISAKLQLVLPLQLGFKKVVFLTNKQERKMEYFKYEKILIDPAEYRDGFRKFTDEFIKTKEWHFERMRKGKKREIDLKKAVVRIEFSDRLLMIKTISGATIFDILLDVYQIKREETGKLIIIRKELLPFNYFSASSRN